MIAIQDPCVLLAALRGDIRNASKRSSLNSQIKVWLNILICDVWYTVKCSKLFMMVPDQNTSTTWKGWTCLWWHQAKAGQSSLGPWICGRHRLEGCRRLSLAHGSMVWRYRIPPLKHPSLQPPQSLNRETAGWDEEEYQVLIWKHHVQSHWTYWSPWGREIRPAWWQFEQHLCKWLQPDPLGHNTQQTHRTRNKLQSYV